MTVKQFLREKGVSERQIQQWSSNGVLHWMKRYGWHVEEEAKKKDEEQRLHWMKRYRWHVEEEAKKKYEEQRLRLRGHQLKQ